MQDMPALGASLAGEEGRGIKEHLIKYLIAEEGGEGEEGEKDTAGASFNPQQRIKSLQQTVTRLKELKAEGEAQKEEESSKTVVVGFLEDLLNACEES